MPPKKQPEITVRAIEWEEIKRQIQELKELRIICRSTKSA
jgi:hypothetical protein